MTQHDINNSANDTRIVLYANHGVDVCAYSLDDWLKFDRSSGRDTTNFLWSHVRLEEFDPPEIHKTPIETLMSKRAQGRKFTSLQIEQLEKVATGLHIDSLLLTYYKIYCKHGEDGDINNNNINGFALDDSMFLPIPGSKAAFELWFYNFITNEMELLIYKDGAATKHTVGIFRGFVDNLETEDHRVINNSNSVILISLLENETFCDNGDSGSLYYARNSENSYYPIGIHLGHGYLPLDSNLNKLQQPKCKGQRFAFGAALWDVEFLYNGKSVLDKQFF